MRHTTTCLMLITMLALGGCIFAPGGGDWDDDHGSARSEPTLGQELLDLDRAHQAGIITTAEYERTKERLLDGR